MESSERAALGRFVLRTKEYLVAVRVRDGLLSLTTMLFHDELRPAKDVPGGGRKPAKERLDRAIALIEAMSEEWDPSRYEDRYRERLLEVIERKKKGKRITVPEDEDEPSPIPDLMAALEQSLAAAKGEQPADDDDGAAEEESRDELYERAQRAGVKGRSSMSKQELADALAER
jgi:DNA end-binding protein Ku